MAAPAPGKNQRSPTFLPLLQIFPVNTRHEGRRIPGIGDDGAPSHCASEVANGRGAAIELTENQRPLNLFHSRFADLSCQFRIFSISEQ